VRILHVALGRDPQSTAALQAIAEAYLALGDARARRLRRRRRFASIQGGALTSVLGDALAASGIARRRRGVPAKPALHPTARFSGSWGGEPAPQASSGGPQFRFASTERSTSPSAWLSTRLSRRRTRSTRVASATRPDDPITVVVQTGSPPHNSRVPYWAEESTTVRFMSGAGLDSVNPRIVSVLRHELAHSFVASRTGGNCPTCFTRASRSGSKGATFTGGLRLRSAGPRLAPHPLISLEGPFQDLSEADATLAYAQSLRLWPTS